MSDEKKQSKLELLASGLSTEAVQEKVVDPSRKAFMSYDFGATKVSNYEKFKSTGSSFVKHYMKETGMGDISSDRADALFHRYIGAAYEREGGIEAAHEAAGKDMFAVMQKLSNVMENESNSNYRQKVFGEVDPRDFNAQKAIAGDAISAMSSIYPGMKTEKPEALAHKWRSLAMGYAEMRDNAKTLVGEYKVA